MTQPASSPNNIQTPTLKYKFTPTLKHIHKQTEKTKHRNTNLQPAHSPGSTGGPPTNTEQVCNGRLEKGKKSKSCRINSKIRKIGMDENQLS